ncbi:FERM and PDZ domain-containing protein 1 [Periophthalmus magnuspinnatus]|uniref:FERM and PDZ domain-containing protein 1 n=1 Tax=Periophthalmus magnuspinnatus TaxID=409849 RepID=UPI00145B8744|nr:FERM and PDZ domain-containing protein 1 [Periophthalmus magnuspinnatus]
MEAQDRSRSPSRRTSRVEQVVGRWLRRSRDLGSRSHSAGRDRSTSEEKPSQSSVPEQRSYGFRFSIQIQRDPGFCSHGLTLSSNTPIVVQDITPGGPADGRLVPGDRLVKINNVCADDLTPAQAAEILRECHDVLIMTVLRTMLGPKSSFITPEKKAKLKCNPVKVRFAEEVEVNGQSQGNSLLFLPNVLKVYLENGQTKAFKFEPNTTVKDIVMTLKEKLSLIRIEHFSLVLEQQPGVTKLVHLHEDERIQQIVQKKEPHDYRCLFRACFVPRDPQLLLEDDPTAFEYLFLQGVNDVLQERFAVEMKCNTALRLAALHIQERLASSGHSPKTNLKTITKTWGIESFVSTTLLRNMKEKDLKKAINYHLKKCQLLQDPKLKPSSVDQARINYLEELCDLKSFGGKPFSATLMLQDRESTVNLLVGARYGVSQVVNRKLSIMTALTDFNSITRVELVPESDRVSLVKIYVQDIKPITLLLETAAAKDMSCLIAGYCRVFIDPNINVFPWTEDNKKHKISAEEGYVSRCASDSDSSTDIDIINTVTSPRNRSSSEAHGIRRKERVKRRRREVKIEKSLEEKKDADTEVITLENLGEINTTGREVDGGAEEHQSEASDSCHVLTSLSCDSLDALEEDDLLSCSSHHISQTTPLQLHHYTPTQNEPHLLGPPPAHSHPLLHPNTEEVVCRKSGDGADPQILTPPLSPSTSYQNPCSEDSSIRFADLSRLVDFLPSPPEASEEDEDVEEELRKRREKIQWDSGVNDKATPISTSSQTSNAEYVFNFDQNDARCYYNLVSNITPDSAQSLPQRGSERGSEGDSVVDQVPILQPPPGFGDSSSEEEFFDARDQLASPEDPSLAAAKRDMCAVGEGGKAGLTEGQEKKVGFRAGGERLSQLRKRSRKRRSYLETDYTSTVSFPEQDESKKQHRKKLSVGYFDPQMLSVDPEPSEQTQNPSPTVSSLTHSEGEPSQLESKPILSKHCSKESVIKQRTSDVQNTTRKQDMEMEPESMESKSVTDLVKPPSPNITVVRCRVEPDGKESADRTGDGKEETHEEAKNVLNNGPFDSHMFLPEISKSIVEKMNENAKLTINPIGEAMMAIQQSSYIEEYILQEIICNSKSFCPPPAPPSSPFVTVLSAAQNDCSEIENLNKGSKSTNNTNAIQRLEVVQSNSIISQTEGSATEDEALAVACSTRTASEEVTDSTTSDNVFEDDEGTVSVNSNLSDAKHDWVVATRKSFIVDTVEAQIGNTKTKRLYSLSSDFSCALFSISSKLGAASNDMSPNTENQIACKNTFETTGDFTLSLTKDLVSPSLAKPEVSTNSPSNFMFQAWSPTIMGRLSASTLRSKIHSLPFYLSRSLESVNQAGLGNPIQNVAEEITDQDKNIKISVTDVNNVTETLDLAIESIESDESDTTVTGSDLDPALTEEKIDEKFGMNIDLDLSLSSTQNQPEDQKDCISVQSMPAPVVEPPTSIVNHFQPTQNVYIDTPGPVTTPPVSKIRFAQPGEDVPGKKSSPSITTPVVVTTQSRSEAGEPQESSSDSGKVLICGPQEFNSRSHNISGGCRPFAICGESSQSKVPLDVVPVKTDSGCPAVSACNTVVDPLDACGCSSVYTNCFNDGDTFDEELTVYEFSCRTESSGPQLNALGLPLITAPVSFLNTPSFPRSVLSSSASELSPLLSPLSDDGPQTHSHKEMLQRLGKQQYPSLPSGFQLLKADVDQLLSVLETTHTDQSFETQRGQHPRDTCPSHFTENKRVLQIEARRLMAGCHRVVGIEQSPEEMFCSLVECFHILVGLCSLVLWFSSCERCERRNADAVSGLVDVTRSFRDFCVAAERASSKRSCQDLSTKLLAKQCTALNASVFCLIQLFRTLTAL